MRAEVRSRCSGPGWETESERRAEGSLEDSAIPRLVADGLSFWAKRLGSRDHEGLYPDEKVIV